MILNKYNADAPDEVWSLDGEGVCGAKFSNIVSVFEPLNLNPLVYQRSPLGIRSLKQAIKMIEAERKTMSLKTPRGRI